MNLRIIGTLISKDFSIFFRNRFFAVVTVLGLVAYAALYFLMPSSVDETLDIGVYAPLMPPAFEQMQGEGLAIAAVESEEALKTAVTDGKYVAGVALPADLLDKLALGQRPRVTVYFASDTPEEVRDVVEVLIRESLYPLTGQRLAIEVSAEVLGRDMMGVQIPPRDRMRPLFAVLLLLTETFGLASLISEEVERRTIQALLVTPVAVKDLFAAKGIMGISLAFGQAALLMAIVGGMSGQPLIILTALLLGAVLVTGTGFLMAALGKDLMSVMAWGVVVMVLLSVPAVTVMFPGTVSGWIKVIPSYYLVDTVHQASNFGAGWGVVWRNLLMLLGFNVVIVWAGIMALRRRFQ